MSDIAIRVEGLGKQYRIGRQQAGYKTIRESISDGVKAPFRRAGRVLSGRGSAADLDETIWALKDVSFEIKRGEVVGVIGRNGAGKTTLLKILSRITEPTTGDAWIRGRVGSLLEVGTGFHPELSGRENIYLNGAILGMKRVEIDRKFDEIVDFTEIEKFIDTPVKHYSSGMYVRLAFSVAAHLEPDILLVDEVLAVGDAAFQKKCLGKMEDVAKIGRTVLFVSHNMAAVQSLCGLGILIDTGRLVEKGSSREVIDEYLRVVSELSSNKLADRKDRHGDGRFRFSEVVLVNEEGESSNNLVSGENATIKLRYEAVKALKHVSISIGIYGQNGQFLLMCNNEMAGAIFEELPQIGEIHCTLPRLPFSSGIYQINLYCEANGQLADWIKEAFQLEVTDGDFYGFGRSVPASHGGFLADQVWELLPAKK